MSGLGTDVLALACIAGSAGVSGAATMAMLRGDAPEPERMSCMVEAMPVTPTVIVTGRNEWGATVLVSPDVRSRNFEACAVSERMERVERIRTRSLRHEMHRARADIERARAEVERARARADRMRADVDRARADAERVRASVERARAEAERARASADQARANAERARREGGGQLPR